ncbi:nuclear transport factor 2 family protein [Micromonospora sp. URMC 106]|uniref:nuclear transport factor 2 family protein n=1 Tax=Micromonospora sp. URMC 106 TaxID=3423408 RepID=UPI003F194F3E
MIDINEFVDRYVGVWNEPDPDARRKTITTLWVEDGAEFTESAEHRGHAAIEARVTGAYEEFVKVGGFVFTSATGAASHHNAIKFATHMVPASGGDVVWTGHVFVLLDQDGRIRYDYQFAANANEPAPVDVSRQQDGSTRAVVEELLRRVGDGDPDRIADLFAEQVDWQLDWPVEGHPAVPWIRPRSTRADVADHFRALDAFHVPDKRGGSVARILVDGKDAVVLAEISQTVKATGRAYTFPIALHVTVEEGQIIRYHVYEDSLTVAQALANTGTRHSSTTRSNG